MVTAKIGILPTLYAKKSFTALRQKQRLVRTYSPVFVWSGRLDLNQRPPEPHSGALPVCATPRTCPDYSAAAAKSQTSRQMSEAKNPRAAPKGSAAIPHSRTAGKSTLSHCCQLASGDNRPVKKLIITVNSPPRRTASRARMRAPLIAQRIRREGDGSIPV